MIREKQKASPPARFCRPAFLGALEARERRPVANFESRWWELDNVMGGVVPQ